MPPVGCIGDHYSSSTRTVVVQQPDLTFDRGVPPGPESPDARHVHQDAGDDAGPGTLAAPWRSIGRALRSLGPGQAAYVHKAESPYREAVVPTAPGSPRDPVWLIGNRYGDSAVVTDADPDAAAPLISVQHPYWIIEGFVVEATGSNGTYTARVVGTHSVVLRDIETFLSGTGRRGVQFVGAKDSAIMDSHIHGFAWAGEESHGIHVLHDCERVLVLNNRCGDNSGDSIQVAGPQDDPAHPGPEGARPPAHITIAHNVFSGDVENAIDLKTCDAVRVKANDCRGYRPAGSRSASGDAIVVHVNADNVVIELNHIWDCGRAMSIGASNGHVGTVSVRWNLIRDMHYDMLTDTGRSTETGCGVRVENTRRAEIYNNTFYNLPHHPENVVSPPSGYAVRIFSEVAEAAVFNNIVMNAGVALHALTSPASRLVTGRNVLHDAGRLLPDDASFVVDNTALPLAGWQDRGAECGSEEADPLFRDVAALDFRPRNGAPGKSSAIDRAVLVDPPGPWPVCDAGPDIGCIESCP